MSQTDYSPIWAEQASAPSGSFLPSSRTTPCPICSDTNGWCTRTRDGDRVHCRRESTGAAETKIDANGSEYHVHLLVERSGSAFVGIGGGKRQDIPFPTTIPSAAEPPADVVTRDRVYRGLLQRLPLVDDHIAQLRQRGLSDAEIAARQYHSLGKERVSAAAALSIEHGADPLIRVPGFKVRDKADGSGKRWTIGGSAGLLIPVRDQVGRVVALKIRKDEAVDGQRYQILSSREGDKGVSPGAPPHFPLWISDASRPTEEGRITEGEIKADVATVLSGIYTVGIPGIGQVNTALEVVEQMGWRRVRLAVDMDARSNTQVASAARRLFEALQGRDVDLVLEVWPAQYKGIDDALAAGATIELREGDDIEREVITWEATSAAVKVAKTNAKTAPKGSTFADVARQQRMAIIGDMVAEVTEVASRTCGDLFGKMLELGLPAEPWQHGLVMPVATGDDKYAIGGEGALEVRTLVGAGKAMRLKVSVLAPRLIIARGLLVDEETQQHVVLDYLTVGDAGQPVWYSSTTAGRARPLIAARESVVSARTLVDWARFGLPIDSQHAPAVATFLNRFITENEMRLPRGRLTTILGWQTDDKTFLWGATALTARGAAPMSDALFALGNAQVPVWVYRAPGEGEERIAQAFRQCGNEEIWRGELADLARYPLARLMMVAALAPALMDYLDVMGSVIDVSCPTEGGKSTLLLWAISAWGRPDNLSAGGILGSLFGSWEDSFAGFRSRASLGRGLPTVLDDSKKAAQQPEKVDSILYMAGGDTVGARSEQGGGLRTSKPIRTLVLSTGEYPVTSMVPNSSGGARTRALILRGMPLGEKSVNKAIEANHFTAVARQNYGFSGPQLVRWLLEGGENLKNRLRDMLVEIEGAYLERISAAGVREASRLARTSALLKVTEVAAREAQALPWRHAIEVLPDSLFNQVLEDSRDAAGELRALRDAHDYFVANRATFWGAHSTRDTLGGEPIVPSGGWNGALSNSRGHVAFIEDRLRKVLNDRGYKYEAIVQQWGQKDWILREPTPTGFRYAVKSLELQGRKERMVTIKGAVIKELLLDGVEIEEGADLTDELLAAGGTNG